MDLNLLFLIYCFLLVSGFKFTYEIHRAETPIQIGFKLLIHLFRFTVLNFWVPKVIKEKIKEKSTESIDSVLIFY